MSARLRTPQAGDGQSIVVLLRLAATGGRSDRLRIALTIVGSAAAAVLLLCAAAVAFISSDDGPYGPNVLDEPGLRPGVMISILMLSIPLIVFIGLCTRVGAPARDRRLAMFRMAGATPGETTRIAALETGLAALFGALAGTGVFLALRRLLDSTQRGEFSTLREDGGRVITDGLVRTLPTDVDVPVPAFVAVIAAVAVGAAVASTVALRKVRLSPFGVSRTQPTEPPTRSAAILFLASTGGLIVLGVAARSADATDVGAVPIALGAFVLFGLCVIGLLRGGASISSLVGTFLATRTSRPDLLIASRRMIAAPYTASRATAAVLLAVLIGAAVQGARVNFLAGTDPSDTFYADTFGMLDGVLIVAVVLATASLLITSAEAIVERRRTLAALVAVGTPRSVLARSAMMESLVPLVPSVALAATAGLLAARGVFGTSVERLETYEVNGSNDVVTVGVPIPWERLAALCGGTIAISLAVTAISLLFLGRSTSPAELRAAA